MTATLSQSPSSADVARGREAVQQELAEAQRTHEQAAYHAATNPGSEDAREQLAQARRRIGVLQSELEGLEAVGREASRREKVQHLAHQIEDAESERTRAHALVDAVEPAFARVSNAIAALAVACDELQKAEEAANRAEQDIAPMPHGLTFYPAAHNCTPMRDALLWLAFLGQKMPELSRSDLVMTVGGHQTPDRPAEILKMQSEKARNNIDRGSKARIAELRERLQAIV